MVLVNEAQGYRVCLECHDVLEQGDEEAWLQVHLGPHGCEAAHTRSLLSRVAEKLHVRHG